MDEELLQDELISFMFRRQSGPDSPLDAMACLRLWFGKSNDTDIEIQSRFGSHVAIALQGKLDHWRKTPRGCLALMILIDQFPRNIYRHTIRSFAGDKMSRDMVYNSGHDWLRALAPEECLFVPCLILTHQENVEDQNYCLEFYDSLEPLLSPSLHIFRMIFKEHQKIISLCGTFPHRDHYYNRTTSVIGKSLMDNPVVRFDLPLCESEDGPVFFGHDPSKLWQMTQHAFDVIDRFDALINRRARRRSAMPADYMTKQRSVEIAEIFKIFDKSGDGFLETGELAAVLASTGHRYSDEQIQEAVDHVTGRKGSAGLTFLQFANLLRINLNSSFEARIRQRFNMFDADQSGEVTLEEFTACVQGLDGLITTAEAAAMFNKCDHGGKGSVSFQDFMGVMKRTFNSVSTDHSMLTKPLKVETSHSDKFSVSAINNPTCGSKQLVIKVQVLEVLDDEADAEASVRGCLVPASHPRLEMARFSSRLKSVLKATRRAFVSAVTPHVGCYDAWCNPTPAPAMMSFPFQGTVSMCKSQGWKFV
jgi:uncharacterized protein (DUF924 family)/Ca2+-binding EF-hand superfamily protein